MKMNRRNKGILILLILSCSAFFAEPAFCDSPPEEGDTLPDMELTSPTGEADRQYLGVQGATFKLKDLDAKVIVIEVIGVYCPYCYEQAPLFKNLFNRLQKGKLKDKVKMFGIAAGGTAMEVEHLRKEGQYNYPLVQDPRYSVHKSLGEPRTPFTMVVDQEGKLLYVHPGTIKDIDPFYDRIGKLAE